ncbi:MAG: methyltransferase domain-containing protein, partial [Gemmatimonadaceae bacterium]|nr:methyltransferase domain-containing protein [Gemmatimonadaceae bacterium]
VLQTREVTAAGRTWRLEMPRSAEDLISEADFARDERLPYWADLWPSGIVLASEVSSLAGAGRRAIEFGAGIGLPSLAAAAAGFGVTVTDYYDDALLFARRNAASNLGRDVDTALLDWRALPALMARFDLVLAADVLYERPYASLVARAVVGALAPDGVALIADPGRVALQACLAECAALGAVVRERRAVRHEDGVTKHTITIHEVRLG